MKNSSAWFEAALAAATIRLSIADQDSALALLAPVAFTLANLIVLGIAAGTIGLFALGRLLPPASRPLSRPHAWPW